MRGVYILHKARSETVPTCFCHCERPRFNRGSVAIPHFAGLLRRPATCGTPRNDKEIEFFVDAERQALLCYRPRQSFALLLQNHFVITIYKLSTIPQSAGLTIILTTHNSELFLTFNLQVQQ